MARPKGPSPPLTTLSAAERRFRAYQLLGIDPNSVVFCAQFTPFFARIPGGIPFAIDALRSSDLPDARAFIRCYDNIVLPQLLRAVLPLEAFAVAAGVTGDQMISAVTSAVRTRAAQLGSITAALAHPAIVELSSQLATSGEEGTTEHMMANLKHMQFLPAASGSRVNVQVNTTATAGSASQSSLPAPSPEASIRRLTQSFQEDRDRPALPASTAEFIPATFPAADAEADPVPVNANSARRAAEARARAIDAMDTED